MVNQLKKRGVANKYVDIYYVLLKCFKIKVSQVAYTAL